jgi:hypothetical protein
VAEAPKRSTPPPGQRPIWGGYSAKVGRVRQGEPALDPLTRRLVHLAAGLSVLLIAVVANSLLHSDENPFNPIAQAAERTARFPGARSRIEAIYTSPGSSRSVSATGTGVYNAQTGRSRAVLWLATPQLGTVEMRSVADRRTSFMRSSLFAGELPPGRRWLAVQPLLGRRDETALAASGGAIEQLSVLRSVGDGVDSLGYEKVDGVRTSRYRATISLGSVADTEEKQGDGVLAEEYRRLDELTGAPIEAEVWIDGRGILRRTRTVTQLPAAPGQPAITMDLRIDLHDFGVKPKISLPPRHQVFDATPIARAQLHMLDGRSLARLIRPPSAPPLADPAFRRRANAQCRAAMDAMRGIARRHAPQILALKRLESAHVLDGRFRAATMRYGLRVSEPIVRLARRYLARAGRLSPPAEATSRYRRYLRNFAVQTEILLAETRIMETGAFAAGKGLEGRKRHLAHASDALARALGLPDCVGDGSGKSAGTAA